MKKFFNLLIISVFLLSTLTVPQISVEAAAGYDVDSLQEGTYTLDVEVLQATIDEESAAAGFLDKTVELTIDGEKALLTITAPDNPMMNFNYLEVDGQKLEPEVKDGSLVFTYTLDSLREIIPATTSYEVPAIGLVHDGVGLRFKLLGLEDIPEKEVEEPEDEIEYTDLDYAVDVTAMERYIDEVKSFEKDGQKYVTVQFNSAKYIANYEVDNGSGLANAEREDVEGNKVNYTFSVDSYDTVLPTKITIDAMGREMVHEFKLALGTEASVDEPEDEIEYTNLDYAVDVAAMERYIDEVKSFEKDGQKYVTVQFNSAEYIANYEVDSGSGLANAEREDVEGNKVNYTFSVDSYDTVLPTKITIDAMGREMVHEFTLSLGKKAATEEEDKLADGEYLIETEILHETDDKLSSAAKYIVNPAKLTVKDGAQTVSFTLTDNESIKDLQVEQNSKLTSAKVDSIDEKTNSRVVSFEVADLEAVLKGQFHVFIPSMNYDAKPNVRIAFNTDTIKEDDGSTPELPEVPELFEDGEYTINYRVLHATEFEKSKMGDYLVAPANLTIKDGKNLATLTINDDETITDFKVEQNGELVDAKVVKVDEENNSRDIQFELDDLDGEYKANISVYVADANYTGNYDVRLFFEENSVKKKEATEQEEEEEETPEQLVGKYVDGVYELPFNILQSDSDDESTMTNFVGNPATLTVKDGKTSVKVTLKSSSMIDYLQVLQNGKYVDARELSNPRIALLNTEDTRDVEFEVADIDEILPAKVKVTVPGMYETVHDVRFAFDTSDIPLIDPNEKPTPTPTPTPEPGDNEDDDDEKTSTGKYLDGEFDLPFEVLRGDNDAISTMGDYVNTPARVVIKDGEATVHVTTEFDSNLNGFKTQFEGKLVDATKTVIGDNVAEYAFNVEDLDALLPAQVSVHVPGIYNETYDVRFKFDTSKLAKNPNHVPGKPGFGKAEENETLPGTGNNSDNPKTGDNAPVVVYSLLFVLSLIMLGLQYRRKLA